MSSKIIASTSSGTALNMSADTSGILEIQTGATPTTAITIDGSQNVGIGTATPASKLQISNTAGYATTTITGNSANGGILSFVDSAGVTTQRIVGFGSTAGENTSLRFDTNGSEKMRIDASGNLLVGTTSSSITAGQNGYGVFTSASGPNSVYGTNTSGNKVFASFNNPNGQVGYILTNGSSTTFATSSDYRLKENVAPMVGALNVVSQLKPVTYKWKSSGSNGQGFIAHELQAVVPDCVTGTKDAVDAEGNPTYQGIDVSFLVATLTAAIQELKAEVDALKAAK